jgi:ribosomal protein S18 acetylase RimI-like enzyme
MSLWADYHKETEGHSVHETERGFIRYSCEPPNCYIHDLYVRPECRRSGHGTELADVVAERARESGCTYLWSRVGLGSATAQEALKANLAYGFMVREAQNGFMIMSKDIGGQRG